MEHHFNTAIAEMYGIEEAIILHHFYYWITKNAANDKHFHDGLYWTFNSKKAYAAFFTYMNETKIARVIKHLEEEDVIKKGNYSSDKWNRTNWYALTTKGIEILIRSGYDAHVISPLVQNDSMDCVKMNNGLSQNDSMITNNNIQNNNKEEEKEYKEKFACFVAAYKKMGGKVRGADTEFNDFKRRHKDWKEILPYLELAVQRESRQREQAKANKNFFPEPKMLQTYLGKQRAWELYVTIGEDITNEEYTPICGWSLNWNDYYNTYIYTGYWNGYIPDGYTDENRPNGAAVMLNNNRGIVKWNNKTKKWEKILE